jgi:hypothetical protein
MQESMPEPMPCQEEMLTPIKKKTSNGQVNFPNLETRQEKLARKRKRREMEYKSTGVPLVMANLSKNHPDYGMSPAEHLRAKRA